MKKTLGIAAIVLVLVAAIGAYIAYTYVYGANTKNTKPQTILIPSGSMYDDVVNILEDNDLIKNISSFEIIADLMNYKSKIHSGKYTIPPNTSNKDLITMLRAGRQTPVNLTLSHARTLSNVAGTLSKNIELDSLTILNYFNIKSNQSKLLDKKSDDIMTLFIPNTYQVYWNIKAEQLGQRLKKERDAFWKKKSRLSKAKDLNMSQQEVYTIASIVQSESTYGPEQPTIAGLYLNRLRRGIPLQADPTVVYATGDFSIRRVLNRHLEIDSPYNTYKYTGLPPGPICMPTISAIDAVLNYEKNDYLYMCAKPGYNSQHNFARSLAEHNNNAAIYRNWLNKEGIR